MNGKDLFPAIALVLVGSVACDGELQLPELGPYADAGFDQVRYLGNAGGEAGIDVELDGRASCDPMGQKLSEAHWALVQAPSGSPVPTGTSQLGAKMLVTVPGEYVLSLRVVAGDRVSEPDYVSVRVMAGEGEDLVVAPPSTTACGDPLP